MITLGSYNKFNNNFYRYCSDKINIILVLVYNFKDVSI